MDEIACTRCPSGTRRVLPRRIAPGGHHLLIIWRVRSENVTVATDAELRRHTASGGEPSASRRARRSERSARAARRVLGGGLSLSRTMRPRGRWSTSGAAGRGGRPSASSWRSRPTMSSSARLAAARARPQQPSQSQNGRHRLNVKKLANAGAAYRAQLAACPSPGVLGIQLSRHIGIACGARNK